MSLIADALKAAQRERQRRESDDNPAASAVLIPLREPNTTFNPKRAYLLVGSGVVVVAALLIVPEPGSRNSLPPAPPLAGAILSQAIAAESQRTPQSRADRIIATPSSPQTPGAVQRIATAPTASPPDSQSTVVLQSASDSTTAEATVVQPTAGELQVAVESQPSAERLFGQAIAAHRSGDLVAARSLYQRVLAVVPDHADALNNLGVIFSGEQEFDRAIEMLHRAADLAPKSAGIWNNIGTALREQGKSGEAIAAFRRALSIDPGHQGARVGLAQQYLAISALSEARTLLEQIVAASPTLAEAHYTLGQVLEHQGDRAGALRAYTTFVTVAPPRLAGHAERVRQYIETLSR